MFSGRRPVIQMVSYEIKKVFSKPGGKIAVVLLFLTTAIASAFAITSVSFVDADGHSSSGFKAAGNLRSKKNAWTGYLSDEVFAEVIRQNAAVEATPEAQSNDPRETNKAYAMKQGFSDIRDIINSALSSFREYNYYRIDEVSPEVGAEIYERRIVNLQNWLASDEVKDRYSDKQKDFFLSSYRQLETPLYYEDADGWNALLDYSQTIIMLTMLILSFLVCGIFSGEHQQKSDAVFFSSAEGRKKGVRAKLYAGFLMVSVTYWALMIVYTLTVLFVLGFGGWNTMIQTTLYGWKSLYHITFFEDYLLTVFGGYIGTMFMLTAEMLLTVITKSAVLAVSLPFALLFIPSFVGNISALSGLIGLFPDQLLQIGVAVRLFNAYEIGRGVIGAVPILFSVYTVLLILMIPVIYALYRKTEVV